MQQIQKLHIDENQLHLLVAQYLHEKGYYQTLYTLQTEKENATPICCEQVQTINQLFQNNQFDDCVAFLKYLNNSQQKQDILIKIQLLDILNSNNQIEQRVQQLIQQNAKILSQNTIQLFKSYSKNISQQELKQFKQQCFKDLQNYVQPYYNENVSQQSVFVQIPPKRIEQIINNYYQIQLKEKHIQQSNINIDIFTDVIQQKSDQMYNKIEQSVNDSTHISNKAVIANQQNSYVSKSSILDDNQQYQNKHCQSNNQKIHNSKQSPLVQNRPIRSEDNSFDNSLHEIEQKTSYVSNQITENQSEYFPFKVCDDIDEYKLQFAPLCEAQTDSTKVQQIVLKQQFKDKNNYQFEILELIDAQLNYVIYNQNVKKTIRKYDITCDFVVKISTGFFLSIQQKLGIISLFDINFKQCLKDIRMKGEIIDVWANKNTTIVLLNKEMVKIDLNTFQMEKHQIQIKLNKNEAFQKVFGENLLVTTNRYFYNNQQHDLSFDTQQSQIYCNEHLIVIGKVNQVMAIELSSHRQIKICDFGLKSVHLIDKTIYGVSPYKNIIKHEIGGQTQKSLQQFNYLHIALFFDKKMLWQDNNLLYKCIIE